MAKKAKSMSASQRQLRVGELIRRSLSEILARGDHFEETLSGVLISVGEVQTSTDLRVAWVSVHPHGGDKEAVMKTLHRMAGSLRMQVTRDIKMKFSPELRFEYDDSYDFAEATQKLIDELPPASEQ